MKKIFIALLSAMFINTSVYADKLVVNGKLELTEAEIIDGKAYFPVRNLFENLRCSVEWDSNTKTVLITDIDGKIMAEIKNGESYLTDYEGNKIFEFGKPLQIFNSKIYISLEKFAEANNAEFEWDKSSKIIKITENGSGYDSVENRVDINNNIGVYNYAYGGGTSICSNGGLATVYDGYIYYSAVSDYDDNTLFIYRMNMDGTDKKIIASVPGSESCTHLKGYNDELYFFNGCFNYDLCKVNIQNGEFSYVVSLPEKEDNLDNAFYKNGILEYRKNVLGNDFYLKDGFLYYNVISIDFDEKNSIYKKEISSGDEKKIFTEDYNSFRRFDLIGNKIHTSNNEFYFMKMDMDGNNIEFDESALCENVIFNGVDYNNLWYKVYSKISDSSSNEDIDLHIFNIKDDKAYFTKAYWEDIEQNYGLVEEKSHKAIYKMDIFADEYIKIADGENIDSINIVGDWIFYRDNGETYMMKTDGSEKSKV